MTLNRVKDSCHGSLVPAVADMVCARRRKKRSSGYVGAHIVNLAQSSCSVRPSLMGWRTAMLFLGAKRFVIPQLLAYGEHHLQVERTLGVSDKPNCTFEFSFFCGCGGQMYAVNAQFMLTVGERRRTATVRFSALCICRDADSSFCQRVAR